MVDLPTVRESAPADSCTHHWQIETPAGETSRGVCKLCGATREFANYSRPADSARSRRTAAPPSAGA